jgi:hypothetical protein
MKLNVGVYCTDCTVEMKTDGKVFVDTNKKPPLKGAYFKCPKCQKEVYAVIVIDETHATVVPGVDQSAAP